MFAAKGVSHSFGPVQALKDGRPDRDGTAELALQADA